MCLHARIETLDPAALDLSWALQLWACSAAPASARDLVGHMVAEVSLPPVASLSDQDPPCEVSAFSWPPAGQGEHVMALALATGRPGQFDSVHDFAVYPDRQVFVHPRMRGNVGYRIDGAFVQFSVERVENPRADTNRSGTLALELWALSESFTGGSFQGHHLAGVEIGSINGQSDLTLQPIELGFIPPPEGVWRMVLMLREWTPKGYVTRDFTNFATNFVTPSVAENESVPGVETSAVTVENPAPAVDMSAPAVEPSAAPVATPTPVAQAAAPVVIRAAEFTVAKARVKKVGKTGVSAPRAKASVEGAATAVSINTASIEELAVVKGLSRKIAEEIVRKRPFTSLDDFRQVKGLGANARSKIRSKLRL